MKLLHILMIALISFSFSVKNEYWKEKTETAAYLHRSVKAVTDVMVHDIYSPPVASRTYAYISIAGYETLIAGQAGYRTLAGQLRDLKPVPLPPKGQEFSNTLAAVQAILTVGKAMVVSEERVQDFNNTIIAEFRAAGAPEAVIKNSIAYGNLVAQHILSWAAKDFYKETRSMVRYAPIADEGSWQPTPPAYMKAVEPHWNKMRPFLLDSAQQFRPAPPTAFSIEKESQFYKEALEVWNIGKNLTEEQKTIASFWDCNPFKMNLNGHVMYASKKISPGGHWINIAQLACKKVGADVQQTAEVYACLAIAISDAFIICWDEKYRSKVIRPETYINQYIDGAWLPLLQTPPFPEYTSGHSVVSSAAAVMLTKMFGDQFAFADSSEVEFDLPVRHFTSFWQAAEEAAISRLYGGIHYMPSIVNGMEEGKKLGAFVLQRLNTRKE